MTHPRVRIGSMWAAILVCTALGTAETPARIGTYAQEVATFYRGPAASGVAVHIHRVPGGSPVIQTDRDTYWSPRHDGNVVITPRIAETRPTRARAVRMLAEHGQQADIRQVALDRQGRILIATDLGLWVEREGETLDLITARDSVGHIWGDFDVRGVALDAGGAIWFATLAGVAQQTADGWRFHTGGEGLPYNDFTCVTAGPGGSMWFGTTKGAIRFKDGEWAYRQGRRWLPNDHVNDIAVDENGNAWIATQGGVAHIERRPMSLAEKAAHYEEEIEKYIKRTPFGYTSEVSLKNPDDKSEVIRHDSDNDGLWTAMYGVGECFGYAATGDPEMKRRAKQAFEALRFLQKVTQGGEHSPPKGYVARTIRSTDGPDPNVGRMERDRISRDTGDALWKVYEPRWPKSADGKWYWKSDTSSDELDGHFFFYPAYYDLVADTEEEKERVREVVRDLTDHLVDHGFRLIDHDGKVTRWCTFDPEHLNHDPDWVFERGLNSLSMLSYLAVAEHITGDAKYGAASRLLIDRHAYDTNAMRAKIQFGLGSGNQSDDEMAFMSFYNLIKYTKDDALREKIQYSLFTYWRMEFPEMNPLFNFVYAASCAGATFSNPWGALPLDSWDGWLEDSVATLKGFPLDRLNWGHQNSHRIDIVRLRRHQSSDPDDPSGPPRGYRVNGKVLPVQERHFNHWNTDAWRLDYGGNGRGLASGTVFLLPYYMGLHHGFIE